MGIKVPALTNLVEAFDPLRERIDSKNAYLGILLASVMFSFSLFMPWVSVPVGMRAIDGGSANGWSEMAYLVALPLIRIIFKILFKQAPIRPNVLILCIVLSLFILAYNNILHRSVWSPVRDPISVTGSTLDIGFWLGTVSLFAIATFALSWALHNRRDQPDGPPSSVEGI